MIKTLSPYYLTIPFASPLTSLICSRYTLHIFIWNGLKNSPPLNPVYTITKNNPASLSSNDRINIARLINDFIDFKPVYSLATVLIDGDNQFWCRTFVTYETGDISDRLEQQLDETNLIIKGYGYGMGGENQTLPSNKILLQGDEFKVNRNGVFNLPILINESEIPLPTLTLMSVTSLGSGVYNYYFTIADFSGNFSLSYRQQGDTEWIISKRYYGYTDGIFTLPSNAISLTGNVEFVVRFFYPLIQEHINSNIITLTI